MTVKEKMTAPIASGASERAVSGAGIFWESE